MSGQVIQSSYGRKKVGVSLLYFINGVALFTMSKLEFLGYLSSCFRISWLTVLLSNS